MNVKVLSADGKEVGTRAVLASWDTREISPEVLHQVAVADLTNRRVFRAHTKDRAERRGGGRKPWKQKGTGRARHASIRSPIWKKGGVTFGPRADRTYLKRTSRSLRHAALGGVVAGKIRDEQLVLLESFPQVSGKTKEFAALIRQWPLQGSLLLLVPGTGDLRARARRASRNLPHVFVADPLNVNIATLLRFAIVVTTPEGMDVLERRATRPSSTSV